MKRRTKIPSKRYSRTRGNPHEGFRWSSKGVSLILMLLVLGFSLVWKENWHDRLSVRVMIVEEKGRDLKADNGTLRAELADLSRITRIENLARKQFGMISPHVPPDTIWCEERPVLTAMGASMFYGFNKRGEP
ncbi:cell division protein FtsL [bacterium]|nr:cell division protein FtsL [bacterium]